MDETTRGTCIVDPLVEEDGVSSFAGEGTDDLDLGPGPSGFLSISGVKSDGHFETRGVEA